MDRISEIVANTRFTAARCVDCNTPIFSMGAKYCPAHTGTCHCCGADIDPDLHTCDSCSRDEYPEPRA